MVSIKRSSSATPPSEPSTPKTTPKKPKTTASPSKSVNSSSLTKTTAFPGKTPTFSAQARGEFLDEIIAAGAKSADLDHLAIKYGVKKSQLVDQLKPNRSNLRFKAVKSVQGGI